MPAELCSEQPVQPYIYKSTYPTVAFTPLKVTLAQLPKAAIIQLIKKKKKIKAN